jgi:hypothetical protein
LFLFSVHKSVQAHDIDQMAVRMASGFKAKMSAVADSCPALPSDTSPNPWFKKDLCPKALPIAPVLESAETLKGSIRLRA